jgi:hypothetical protein
MFPYFVAEMSHEEQVSFYQRNVKIRNKFHGKNDGKKGNSMIHFN